jgi:hypothetical protein
MNATDTKFRSRSGAARETGGSNYTGFRLTPVGRLTPVPGSTVALPSGSQPGDVLFNGTGTKLAGTRVGTSQIDGFTVGPDGRLTAAPGSPTSPTSTHAIPNRRTPAVPRRRRDGSCRRSFPNTTRRQL